MYNICSCFDFLLPQSTESSIIIPPIDKTFITGLSYAYDATFPPQLSNRIDPEIYYNHINTLNRNIQDFWPCPCAEFVLGYGCCICSAGISLCIPFICLSDAEEAAERQIRFMNQDMFTEQGMEIRLVKKRPISYLEICLKQRTVKENELVNQIQQEKKIQQIINQGIGSENQILDDHGNDSNKLI